MTFSTYRETAVNFLVHKHQQLLDQAIALDPKPPMHLSGRGIVICAGGPRYFTCAWVLLQQLRDVIHCTLPVEIWYAGSLELDDKMLSLLHTVPGVETVDATQIPDYQRILSCPGWALKPFALIHSRFREVLMLDADNLPVINPEFLFEDPHYAETGAIFWPDIAPFYLGSLMWKITRTPCRLEPSFESGQMLVDKQRSWKALMLTMHLNEHANFYYKHVYGDKDTFHFGWHAARLPYSMPALMPRGIKLADVRFLDQGPVLLQCGFDNRVIFQHRNWPKWTAFGRNAHYNGTLNERECLLFLKQLAGLWNGKMSQMSSPPSEQQSLSPAGTNWYHYVLIGSENRPLEFLPDGHIGHGAKEKEQRWALTHEHGKGELLISGAHGTTCCLTLDEDGTWRGRWLFNERHLVELIPCSGG